MTRVDTGVNPLAELRALLARQGGLAAAQLTGHEAPDSPLGELVLAGPLGRSQPVRAVVFEAVREGYLAHYGIPRVIEPGDADLALLAGDLLYALGLRELAALGEPGPVESLASLIAMSAQMEASGLGAGTGPLWLAHAVVLGTGDATTEPALTGPLLAGEPGAGGRLLERTRQVAGEAGVGSAFELAREAIQ